DGKTGKTFKEQRNQHRKEIVTQRGKRQDFQERANRVAAKLRALALAEQLGAVQREIENAEAMAKEVRRIETYLADHPAPDEEALKALKANRQLASRLTADREAASLNLSLVPESGAPTAEVAIDGGPLREIPGS